MVLRESADAASRIERVDVNEPGILGDYMRRLRVDWAAEQLIVTRRPISWTAADAGFADQAHLTRWFGRVMGTTRAAYRQLRQR